MTSTVTEPRVLGEGLLEVDYSHDPLEAAVYRWDDVIGLHFSEQYAGHDIVFPSVLAGVHGTLVAVVSVGSATSTSKSGLAPRLPPKGARSSSASARCSCETA